MARIHSTIICNGAFVESDAAGLRMSPTWHVRPVGEITAVSTKDGPIERIADPVTMIDADIRWTNTSGDRVAVFIVLARPARSLVSSNPNAVSIVDAVTYDIDVSPMAPEPTPRKSGMSARLKTTRSTAASPAFGRLFVDSPPSTSITRPTQTVEPGETIHVRYRCTVSTPGEWRTAAQPVTEAWARYARLRLYSVPATLGSN